MQNKIRKILFTGGGTGGSVTPLLALEDELKTLKVQKVESGTEFEFLWVGTKFGPEKEMVENAQIKFKAISSGKFRRYFSINNFFDVFKIIAAFCQSLSIIFRFKPDLIMSAGSFSSVPVIWAGWILRKKIIIHQMDSRPGLANKLMAPFADVITVSFEDSLKDYGKKAVWTGNFTFNACSISHNSLPKKNILPVVLVVGGGTGAEGINKLVWESLDELNKICKVVHVTGRGKSALESNSNYQSIEFLEHEKLMGIMSAAELVVSRAGMGFLTEISYLEKAVIIIPMPNSHQEENAAIFERLGAAVILKQKKLTPLIFTDNIKKLLNDGEKRKKLAKNAAKIMKKDANKEIIKIMMNLLS